LSIHVIYSLLRRKRRNVDTRPSDDKNRSNLVKITISSEDFECLSSVKSLDSVESMLDKLFFFGDWVANFDLSIIFCDIKVLDLGSNVIGLSRLIFNLSFRNIFGIFEALFNELNVVLNYLPSDIL